MNIRYTYLSKMLSLQIVFLVGIFTSSLIQAHDGEDHSAITITTPSSSTNQNNDLSHGNTPGNQSNRKFVSITKGERIKLSIKDVCDELIENCKVKNLSIFRGPVEGILFPQDAEGHAFYQHAGTSNITDEIVFSYAESDTDVSRKFSIIFEVTKSPAKLVFLSPASNFQTTNRFVTVYYKVSGDNFGHLHMSLYGGTEHISVYDKVGSHTFKELPIGENRIDVTMARKDHRNIPGTTQSIVFKVTH